MSFWWFYLVQLLATVVSYGYAIFAMMGMELPGNGDVWYFMFMTCYFGIHFAANYFLRSRVEVAYAPAYDCLKPEEKKPEGVVLGNIFQM